MSYKPISEEEYQKIRENTLKELNSLWEPGEPRVSKLTCDECPAKLNCEYSGDGYNTNGDCLAAK